MHFRRYQNRVKEKVGGSK